ncbi:hypothetical protein SDC9_153236 [bioreactor metagenome]|uniref:Uncharacterized protein n=1 Tax=bioreactor metagenome TaxID=1076179 RepID=A0A645EXL3_9ZZZZ
MNSTINEWLEDPRGKKAFEPVYETFQNLAKKTFIGDKNESTEAAIGMDVMQMFGEMPLVSVLLWVQGGLNKPAEEIVADMLAQARSL